MHPPPVHCFIGGFTHGFHHTTSTSSLYDYRKNLRIMIPEPTLEPTNFHISRRPGFPSFREGSRVFVLLLLLLWWLPQSTKAQGTTFEVRKQAILTAIVNTGLPTKTTDGTRVGDAMLQKAVAHYALGQNAEGNSLVDSALTDGSGAMFYFYMVMYNYLKFGDRMDQPLKDRIKTKMTGYGGGINGSTQNHSLMYAAAFTLARETWPDATFAHALGYGAADPDGKQMIINGMKKYVTEGCEEADSYFYTVFYVNCYAMIHEFSKDRAFSNMAKLTCDWFLLGAANNWLKGYMVGPDNRTSTNFWGANECPQDPGMSSVCYYLYFGADQPFNLTPDSTALTMGTVGGSHSFRKAALNCVSSYVCPADIVKIARTRTSAFVGKETHIKDGAMGSRRGLYRSTYLASTWGITGQKDVSYSDYYQKQMLRWFVRWISDEPYSTFNLYMPNFERTLAECSGRTKYEQIMQHKRTVIGVTRAPADYRYPFVYGLIPKAPVKATLEDSGWMFLHADKVLIATKFARPYHWAEETSLFKTIQSDGAVNGYIVQTADAGDYPGTSPADQLVNFKNAIVALTVPDFSMIDTSPSAPVVSFRNLDGDQMTIAFSEARDENHVLNGSQVDYYGTWPLIDNPWAHQDEGSSLLNINVDDVQTTYNFDAWSRSSGATDPDLYPTGISYSRAIPTAGLPMTFTATVRNSGTSSSGTCSVSFLARKLNGTTSTISTGIMSALGAGASTTITSSEFIPTSSEYHTIIVEVDYANNVPEIEEYNNSISSSFVSEKLDLALQEPITASSGNGSLANDADAYSYWQSSGLPATLTVDLGESTRIAQIRLSERPDWATVRNMTLEVLVSNDGSTYATVKASATYAISPRTIDLGDVLARYVRLNVTACTPNNYAELAKFQIYAIDAPLIPTGPPVITSSLSKNSNIGVISDYQIAASNSPQSYDAAGLPPGMSVNTATGVISGIPTQLGTFSSSISATNTIGTASATLAFNILPPPPVIISHLADNTANGLSYSYQIAGSNSPQSFNASGLPGGLSVNTGNGLITGTVTQTGVFNIIISATNDGGTGSATLALVVLAQPAVSQFWDGGTADKTQNGTIEGGPGTWNASLVNWADAPGTTEGAWVGDNHAVFGATGGTVTVGTADGTAGTAISAGDIIFATTGCTLNLGVHTSTNSLTAKSLSGSAATITSGGTGANGQFILTNPSAVTWSGTISTGNFTKTGAGTLNFTGSISNPGTYGSMSFQGGTTHIGSGTTLSGPGFYTSNSGTVVNLGNNNAGSRVVTIGYGSEVTTSGTARLRHASLYDKLISYGTLSGFLGIEFAHNGSANSNLFGANTYSGGTYFTSNSAGFSTLNVHHDTSLGTGKVALTSNKPDQTTIIRFLSPTPAIGSLECSNLGIKNIVLGNGSSNLQGKWTAGSNIITLSADSIALAVGQTIPGSAGNGIPANAVITEITSGTTFKLSENATITKTSNTAFTAAPVNTTLTVGALNTETSYAGLISENAGTNGGLNIIGTGKFTLLGTASYTGSTTVSNGALLVNGSLHAASIVTVESIGTLGGTGTIGGAVTIGGTLSPGSGAGSLNTGETILNSGAILAYELDGDDTTTGGGINDLVIVTGNLTLDGTLNVTGANFAAAAPGDTYRLFTYSGTLTDNTLNLGSMPTLPGGYTFLVNTETSGQVNLIVSTGTRSSTYTSWASTHSVSGAINGDSDKDGIPNGVEYGLNTNPAASDGTPGTCSGNVLSFDKRTLTSDNSDLSYRIEVSSDLGVSDPWTEVSAYITNSSSVISAHIATGSAKKFARLRVVVSP
jgi:autotransporter-associated beta strand protein